MKRLVTSFTLLFAMCCGVMAQNEAIYQYRNDGKGKSMFLKSKVDSVVYSQKDIQSNVKNEYVVREIWTQYFFNLAFKFLGVNIHFLEH